MSGRGVERNLSGPAISLAAVLYLAAALWTLRAVLPAPGSLLPLPNFSNPAMQQLSHWDMGMVLSVVTRNADTLVRAPWRLLGSGQCYPLEGAHTLGEHMFGTGLVAALPYLVTRDPVWSYNATLIFSIWVAGIGMYLFAFELVRRSGPAFVAGLLFALTPERVSDVIHPFVHGDHWTPLAALFLHRLLAYGGARNAVGLALFAALAMLESLYAMVASGIVLGSYAVHLLWTYRAHLIARLPAVASVVGFLVLVGWLIFAPYLETRANLGILKNRGRLYPPLAGSPLVHLALTLSLVAVLDRMRHRRARAGDDPRLAFVCAATLSLWLGQQGIAIGEVVILPSPLPFLSGLLPGFDAVRAPHLMGLGVWFVWSLLGAFGVQVLGELSGERLRLALPVCLSLVTLAERGMPAWSERAFGKRLDLVAWSARPDADDLRLLRSSLGPIVHVPMAVGGVKGLTAGDQLRLVSFDPRATSACYNSFPSPLSAPMAELVAELPAPAAVDALHALGFRTVLVHVRSLWPPDRVRFERRISAHSGAASRLVLLGRNDNLQVYALDARSGAADDLRMLAHPRRAPGTDGVEVSQSLSAGGVATLQFAFVNYGLHTFHQPRPLGPRDMLVRWSRDGTTSVETRQARLVLPLALAPGARQSVALETTAPAADGNYRVTLSPLADPETVVSALEVAVRGPAESVAISDPNR